MVAAHAGHRGAGGAVVAIVGGDGGKVRGRIGRGGSSVGGRAARSALASAMPLTTIAVSLVQIMVVAAAVAGATSCKTRCVLR